MNSHLPLNALKAFDAAARHMSFRKAAEELNVTPAAISQQIRTLEELVGSPLFIRAGRGLSLTSFGEAGLVKLREGLTSLSDAYRLMRDQDSGRLTLAVAPSICSKWLLPRLQHCSEFLPDVELAVHADSRLIDDARTGVTGMESSGSDELKLSIRFGGGIYPGCHVTRLMSATAVPLCSPSLLRHTGRELSSAEGLDHHTLLHDDTAYEGHVSWNEWLKQAGLPAPGSGRGVHFNNVSLALDAAVNGQGVVLSLAELAQDDIAAGRLMIPFGPAIPLVYAWHIVCEENLAAHPTIRTLTDWLVQQVSLLPELGLFEHVTPQSTARSESELSAGIHEPVDNKQESR